MVVVHQRANIEVGVGPSCYHVIHNLSSSLNEGLLEQLGEEHFGQALQSRANQVFITCQHLDSQSL